MPTRRELANALRVLTIDAVQKANSGHPGAPLGMADIAEVLWNDYLKHSPRNPKWPNRDRFVLSNGHASMLLYSALHLSGYDISLDDLKAFRQYGSKTPGHPERGVTPGVESTTGPLGQGLANAVGMALAERTLAAYFNRDGFDIVDHYTYVFAGDGCLMEGISHEACSLAGKLELGKLIVFYDDNGISIDGEIRHWFNDNSVKRFDAYRWHVITRVDGHDSEAISAAIRQAKSVTDKPSLICCRTTIGYGSPNKQGTELCHGAALGEEEVELTRKMLQWPYKEFEIPNEIRMGWNVVFKGNTMEQEWHQSLNQYEESYPDLAKEYRRRVMDLLPNDWYSYADKFIAETQSTAESVASRKASQNAIQAYAKVLPELIGGSADLTHSNLTLWDGARDLNDYDHDGNYVYYGVREFGMSAIINGMSLHGGLIPFGGTFLTFSDYARNAIRMAALMEIQSIFVFTHDSIFLGEDGPTHQPIEHLTSLRLIPNLDVWRPADAAETAAAWKFAISRQDGPSCLVFSRQQLMHQERTEEQLALIERGAYVLKDSDKPAKIILLATGSELQIAMEAAEKLSKQRKHVRVVSMPCSSVFESQEAEYKESVLPSSVSIRVAIEAGSTLFWKQYVGCHGEVIGIDRFGDSAPAEVLAEKYGMTVENIIKVVKHLIAEEKK